MQAPAWDDLALFAMVARNGSLTHAARQAGVSIATLSRRMKALESRMGRRLFLHGAQGYTPAADGRALLERCARMEAAAAEIAQWQASVAGPVRVRISAGTWTALHLAAHLDEFWQPGDAWVPEFLHCNRDLDIARREIDIGVRNRRPEQPWLAGRRTGVVRYAVYARSGEATGWIGSSDDAAATRSSDWVRRHHGAQVVTTANDPRLALAMAQAGVGRILLPCFVGDGVAGLMRLSEPLAEMETEEWIVCHHDARFEPGVRAALDAMAGFLTGTGRTDVGLSVAAG